MELPFARTFQSSGPFLKRETWPILLDLRANLLDGIDDPREEGRLPDTVLTLLLAKCDPNDFGSPAMCPLGKVIRLQSGTIVNAIRSRPQPK